MPRNISHIFPTDKKSPLQTADFRRTQGVFTIEWLRKCCFDAIINISCFGVDADETDIQRVDKIYNGLNSRGIAAFCPSRNGKVFGRVALYCAFVYPDAFARCRFTFQGSEASRKATRRQGKGIDAKGRSSVFSADFSRRICRVGA